MTTQPQIAISALDEVLDFLTSQPTLEAIVEFHPSPAIQEHAYALLERQRNERLTPDEQAELDEIT